MVQASGCFCIGSRGTVEQCARLGTGPFLRLTVPGLCHMTFLQDDPVCVWWPSWWTLLLLEADLPLITAAPLLLCCMSAADVLIWLQHKVMRVVAKKMDIPCNSAFQQALDVAAGQCDRQKDGHPPQ